MFDKFMSCPVSPRTIRLMILATTVGLLAAACTGTVIAPVDDKHPANPAAPQAEMQPLPDTLSLGVDGVSADLIEGVSS